MSTIKDISSNRISRSEALRKGGKYAAFTAAAAVVLLAPKAAQAYSGGLSDAGTGYRTGTYSPPDGGTLKSSPFIKPENSLSSSDIRKSPW